MREVIFRGKRITDGKLVEGMPVANSAGEIHAIMKFNSEIEILEIGSEVEQYTGLTDKNGKKIWEGDIVKTHYANTKKSDFVEIVVFHNGQFCAFHSNNNYKQWAMLYDGVEHLAIDKSVYMDSVEVIGNIHDNSELLKGGVEE